MDFQKAVSDDPVFPYGDLPKDPRYRPDLGDTGLRKLFVIALIVGIPTYIVLRWNFPMHPLLDGIIFILLCGLVILVINVWRVLRANHLTAIGPEALSALGQREFSRAERLVDEACAKSKASPYAHAYLVHLRSVTAFQKGEYAQAISLAGAVYSMPTRYRSNKMFKLHWAMSVAVIAYAKALLRDTHAAEEWQALAHAHMPEDYRGALMGADVAIGVQTARAEIVVRDAETHWRAAESILQGNSVRNLRVLIAFAIATINTSGARDAEIERWLSALHPRQPGEFNHLGKHWPELQKFIEEKGL